MYICFEGKHLLHGMKTIGKRGIPSGCHGGVVYKIQIVKEEVKKLAMSREHFKSI